MKALMPNRLHSPQNLRECCIWLRWDTRLAPWVGVKLFGAPGPLPWTELSFCGSVSVPVLAGTGISAVGQAGSHAAPLPSPHRPAPRREVIPKDSRAAGAAVSGWGLTNRAPRERSAQSPGYRERPATPSWTARARCVSGGLLALPWLTACRDFNC